MTEPPEGQRWAVYIKTFLEGQQQIIDPIHDLRWTKLNMGYQLDVTRMGTLATQQQDDNFFFTLLVSAGVQPLDLLDEGQVGDEPFFLAQNFVTQESQSQQLPSDIYKKLMQIVDSQLEASHVLKEPMNQTFISFTRMRTIEAENHWTPDQIQPIPSSRRPSFALVPRRIHNLMADLMDYFRNTPSLFRPYNQVLPVRTIQQGGFVYDVDSENQNMNDNFDAESGYTN